METVLKILNELHNNKIDFCLQSRVTNKFYNLKVITPQGKEQYINSNDINIVKDQLIIVWGHLIGSTTTVIKTSAPIPLPPQIPAP